MVARNPVNRGMAIGALQLCAEALRMELVIRNNA